MSPRNPETNQALLDERRALILETALDVFVSHGYEGTRIQDIADKARLSHGLIYHYFSSKETLFEALVDSALRAASGLLGAISPKAGASAIKNAVEYALRDPSPRYIGIIIQALTTEGVAIELKSKIRSAIVGFGRIFAAACPAGTPKGRAEAAADSVMSLLLGYSFMKLCGFSEGGSAGIAAGGLIEIFGGRS